MCWRSGVISKKAGHNLAYEIVLNVGPCLWPSHGCAWCWRTSPHLTTNPINPILLLLLMYSKSEWPLVESYQPHSSWKYVPSLSLSLSLSFIFFWAIITCTMTSHPSCFTSYSPILTPPSWFKLMKYVISSKHLVIPVFPYYLVVAYNMIHHFPSILMLYIEISRGLIRS